jgi:hypothetical protein
MSTKPQVHATKYTVVVGLDRPTVRLFSDQAKAETERDFLVQHGRQAYLWKAASALGSHALRKPIRYRGSCARAADIHSRDGPPALCGYVQQLEQLGRVDPSGRVVQLLQGRAAGRERLAYLVPARGGHQPGARWRPPLGDRRTLFFS